MAPTEEIPAGKKMPAQTHKPTFDAKRYLESTLTREAGQFLKVVQIPHTDSFRVNWYESQHAQKATMPGLSIMYIRKSKFLFCRLDAQGNPQITYPEKQ